MLSRPASLSLHPAQVEYVRDLDQVILVSPENHQKWILQGIDAAVWNWLTLGYGYMRVVNMITTACSVSNEEASCLLQTILAKWVDAGLLNEGQGDG